MSGSFETGRQVLTLPTSALECFSKSISEVSRGFGFIRFSTVEESKAFVERNYPTIHLYGNGNSSNDDQTAKVRIAFSRERDDRSRGDKADGEWTCKIVCSRSFLTFLPSI